MNIYIDETLSMEHVASTHVDAIYALVLANRSHLAQWLPWVEHVENIHFIENFVRASQLRTSDGLEHAFVIIRNGEIVGRIGIYKIDVQNRIGEIGYWLAEKKQGKGIVTKACSALLDFCFHNLQLNRIEIKCGTENHKSQTIPERLHFKLEGILREAEFVREAFIDLHLYALMKNDHISAKKNLSHLTL